MTTTSGIEDEEWTHNELPGGKKKGYSLENRPFQISTAAGLFYKGNTN